MKAPVPANQTNDSTSRLQKNQTRIDSIGELVGKISTALLNARKALDIVRAQQEKLNEEKYADFQKFKQEVMDYEKRINELHQELEKLKISLPKSSAECLKELSWAKEDIQKIDQYSIKGSKYFFVPKKYLDSIKNDNMFDLFYSEIKNCQKLLMDNDPGKKELENSLKKLQDKIVDIEQKYAGNLSVIMFLNKARLEINFSSIKNYLALDSETQYLRREEIPRYQQIVNKAMAKLFDDFEAYLKNQLCLYNVTVADSQKSLSVEFEASMKAVEAINPPLAVAMGNPEVMEKAITAVYGVSAYEFTTANLAIQKFTQAAQSEIDPAKKEIFVKAVELAKKLDSHFTCAEEAALYNEFPILFNEVADEALTKNTAPDLAAARKEMANLFYQLPYDKQSMVLNTLIAAVIERDIAAGAAAFIAVQPAIDAQNKIALKKFEETTVTQENRIHIFEMVLGLSQRYYDTIFPIYLDLKGKNPSKYDRTCSATGGWRITFKKMRIKFEDILGEDRIYYNENNEIQTLRATGTLAENINYFVNTSFHNALLAHEYGHLMQFHILEKTKFKNYYYACNQWVDEITGKVPAYANKDFSLIKLLDNAEKEVRQEIQGNARKIASTYGVSNFKLAPSNYGKKCMRILRRIICTSILCNRCF